MSAAWPRRAAPAGEHGDADAASSGAKRQRILVVDDEKNMRTTLCDILRDEGYEVGSAENGEKALRLFHKQSYDVVLMDVRMPGMDGVETFLRIRERHRNVRVIMMSAYSVDRLEAKALEHGAIAFLRKPLDVDRVLALIGD